MKKIVLFLLIVFLSGCGRAASEKDILDVANQLEWLKTDRDSSYGMPSIRLIYQNVVMYFDPGSVDFPENHSPADIIFITHNDKDHMNINTVRRLMTPDTVLVTNAYTAKYFTSVFDGDKLMVVEAWDKFILNGIPVEAVPMYRPWNSRLHPKYRGYTGYVLDLDGVRFYFSGSAGLMDELERIAPVDIACMNVRGMIYTGGTDDGAVGGGGHDAFNLDKLEALEAIRILQPRVFFPVYWMPSMTRDTEYIADHAPDDVLVLLRPPL